MDQRRFLRHCEAGGGCQRARDAPRAKQMVAVTQLVPVTMTVNLITVSIVVGLFWDSGENAFLALWALPIAGAFSLAARSWMRSHRSPPNEASLRAIHSITLRPFLLAAVWG